MSTVRARNAAVAAAVGAVAAVAALTITGCGILPAAPSPAPTDFVPEVTASRGDASGALSPDGFSAAQRMSVRVRNIGCGFLATGSGFALDDHTLVTNRHVVDNAKHIEISTYDGRVVQATAASATTIADIAIVTTKESIGQSYADLASSDPVEGDVITVVGYPSGGRLTTTSGVVIGPTSDPLGRAVGQVLASTAQIELGSSGSAVFNAGGQVVGVIYAKNDSDQSFIVPISTLNSLLDEPSLLVPESEGCSS
ncbi:trypsin-like peptidase domain-containing protein [Demequina sp.]|uniref:trypsin-like peptidase domain-containing protein n=1 Tax=Demequina sp. TaxID=2050685 RepID=UPI003D14C211